MPVHVQAQRILDQGKLLPPMETLDVAAARQRCIEAFCSAGTPEKVDAVRDRMLEPGTDLNREEVRNLSADPPPDRIRARFYSPGKQALLPALVYFHGGGFVVNNLDTHDAVCRRLANAGRCMVISVDYARGPEHPYPAALQQAYAVTSWVVRHARELGITPGCIAVGGDSSGGTLAAGVALMARDFGLPDLCFQLLIYPVTDHCLPGTRSYKEFETGYSLTRPIMTWFFDQYILGHTDLNAPYLFPARAPTFENLPPAHIVTAEYDILRDEGEAYAEKLENARVTVSHKRYPGMIHGFVLMHTAIDTGIRALEEMGAILNCRFSSLRGKQRHHIKKETGHVY